MNVFDYVPLTYIITEGLNDPEMLAMMGKWDERKGRKKGNRNINFWILKPGEFSNRGNGIECTNKLEDIKKRVLKTFREKKNSSLIIQ